MRFWPFVALAVWAIGSAGAQLASAQPADAPAPTAAPSRVTTGVMHAIHATERLERTLAFYTDVFGITAPIRPFENPAVPVLTNSPGVSLRLAMLSLPGQGFNFELTEFSNVERRAAQASIVDPGAPHLKILVRDLAPVLAALDEQRAPIVTRSYAPVRVTTALGTVDAIFCRDPDGYLLEVIQVSADDAETLAGNAEASGNVVGAIMGVTVADLDESLAFWNGLLGFELEADPEFSAYPSLLDLRGVKCRIAYRTAHRCLPG